MYVSPDPWNLRENIENSSVYNILVQSRCDVIDSVSDKVKQLKDKR